jgi:hypothetical protein
MNEQVPFEEQVEQCWSVDECEFNYQTLGDLLDCHDELEAGTVVYVGAPVRNAPSTFIGDADDIIERMGERAYDEHGECAEDFPDDVSKEAKDELTAFLVAWADKHCEARFYGVENIRPYTITAEDLE